MTQQTGPKMIITEAQEIYFKDVTTIQGDGFVLHLSNRYMLSDHAIPGYEFEIRIDDAVVGMCELLIESDFSKIEEIGNYGVTITNRHYYGLKLPSRVATACLALFKSHGIHQILITYDQDHNASATTCEELGATYLDTLQSQNGHKPKRRHVLVIE